MNIEKITKTNQLRALIREVGRSWGEDEVFLKAYVEEQVEVWLDNIDLAIECFQDLKVRPSFKGF